MAKNNKTFSASDSLTNLYFNDYLTKENDTVETKENLNENTNGLINKVDDELSVTDEIEVIDNSKIEHDKEVNINTDITTDKIDTEETKELRDVRQSFLWTESLTNDMNILVTMKYRNKRKSLNDLVITVLEDYIRQEENQELIARYKEFFSE